MDVLPLEELVTGREGGKEGARGNERWTGGGRWRTRACRSIYRTPRVTFQSACVCVCVCVCVRCMTRRQGARAPAGTAVRLTDPVANTSACLALHAPLHLSSTYLVHAGNCSEPRDGLCSSQVL